jgi:microsomal dipeptidase-like Zn-dependent dipeptidase
MPYFDLHCHPTFKFTLVQSNGPQSLPIEQGVQIKFKGIAAPFANPVFWALGDPLDSQSCILQVFDGGSNLVSLTIYALENAYTRSSIISALSCVSNALNATKIADVRESRLGYGALMKEQIDDLLALHNKLFGTTNRTLKIISDFTDYAPNDAATLHVVLNFEGGHCFYTSQANSGPTLDNEVIQNLIVFKQSPIRPLYITLVHHAQNALANHAFAVPTMWAGAGTNTENIGGFNPTGEGITPLGMTFIDEALSTRNGQPIYIDVKHMSLGSRIAYYELRKEKYPHIPIIASHMGVTGLSWNDTQFNGKPVIRWVRRETNYIDVKYNNIISFPKTIPQPSPTNPVTAPTSVVTFNPLSINLYNEDIDEILASDGLIGVSLDIRILGMGNDGHVAHEHEAERLSLNEQLFSVQKHLQNGQNDFDQLPDTRIQASLNHLDYLCNNLLHIVRVGRKTIGEHVWDHICLGSDLDGLIVSVEFQTNKRVRANDIPMLRAKLKETLPKVAQKLGMSMIVDGTPKELFLEQVLDKFFFKNALQFLEKYYTRPVVVVPDHINV